MTLAAHRLAVTLSGLEVLQDITATLEPGSITAICGPNGAGKSTLLAALAGLQRPSAGHVQLTGLDVTGLPARERARRIGYLPQSGDIAWDLSVANLVALGRLPHQDRGDLAVAAALDAVDIANLAKRPISTLSGGEKARALLARVLAGEPDWILADEPLAALDLGHQFGLLTRLRSASDAGAGLVLVLHDLTLAMNHAHRVLVLDCGRIVADGEPEEALSEDVVAGVWKVRARWLGERGARALITG